MDNALKDPFVRTGHRLMLMQRFERLRKAPRSKKVTTTMEISNDFETITDPVEVSSSTIIPSFFISN